MSLFLTDVVAIPGSLQCRSDGWRWARGGGGGTREPILLRVAAYSGGFFHLVHRISVDQSQ